MERLSKRSWAWEFIKAEYGKRGYFVQAFPEPHAIGEILSHCEIEAPDNEMVLPQPFRIMSETTREDYRSQYPAGFQFGGIERRARYFYRTVTE